MVIIMTTLKTLGYPLLWRLRNLCFLIPPKLVALKQEARIKNINFLSACAVGIIVILLLPLSAYAGNTDRKHSATTDIAEYVSRVGKRILIVMDCSSQNYEFVVLNSAKPTLQSDQSGKIQISIGLLNKLQDEAELAAVLSQKIVLIKHIKLYFRAPTAEHQVVSIDKLAMTYMFRAGYDPDAMVELQEIALNNANPRHGSWITALFKDNQPTTQRLAASKAMAAKLPHGLQRGREQYKKNIKS